MPLEIATLFLGFPLGVVANFMPEWYHSLTKKPLEALFFDSFKKVLKAQDKNYGYLFSQFVNDATNKENREKILNIFESGMDPENPGQALELIQTEEFRNSVALKIVKEFQLEEKRRDTLVLIVKESLANYKKSFFKHMSTPQGFELINNQLLQIYNSLGQIPQDLAKKKDIDNLIKLLQKNFKPESGKKVIPEEPADRSKLPLPGDIPEKHRMPYRSLGNGFVGRVQDLWDIDDSLRKNKNTVVQGVGVVTGMGGVGKTQLAVEYVHRFGKYYPGGVFWVEADQGLSALLVLVSRAAGIDIDNRLKEKDQLEQLWQILSSFSPVLVVLDNFPEKIGLEVWLPPQSSIHVLVTTRRKDLFKYSYFSVDVLTKEEGIELLNSGKRKFAENAADLVEAMGGLPLAIELAKNFLNLRTNLSITGLLEEIKKKGEIKTLGFFAGKYENELPTGHSKEVAATFQLSWDLASDFAKTTLQVISLLAPAPVPRRVLKKIFDTKSKEILEDPVDEAVGELIHKLSLTERDEENDPSCHRLISAFVRTVIKKDTDLNNKIVQTIIDEMARTKESTDTDSLTELEKVLPHAEYLLTSKILDVKPEKATSIANYTGWHHLRLGRYRISEEYRRLALQMAEANFEPGNPKIALIQNDLGEVLYYLGEYEQAISSYEKAFASDFKTYGIEHPKVAEKWNNLGSAWKALGQYEKAISYLEKALASDLKTYGSEHPEVAIDWNNLGSAYYSLGQYQKAISYFEKSLASDIKTYGSEHPEVATSWNNLGSSWKALSQYQKAISYFEKSLASDLKTYSNEHPKVAIYWNNLGLAWDSLGQYEKAIEYYEKSLASNLKTYGIEHPAVAERWNNLGSAYYSLGQYQEAISYFEKALKIRKTSLGKDHHFTKETKEWLDHAWEKLK